MSKLSLILTLGAFSLLPLERLLAQSPVLSPSPAASPASASVSVTPGKGAERYRELLERLSPEEREKLRLARQAAMADPAVQAASSGTDKRVVQRAMRDAMLRNDPSIAPVLAKLREGAEAQKVAGQSTQSGAQPPGAGEEMEKRIAFLPEEERAKLRRAYSTANGDPQLSALRQQWMSASTPEAKAQSGQAYREGVRNAMLRNDPSIAPILQKVRDQRLEASANTQPPAIKQIGTP